MQSVCLANLAKLADGLMVYRIGISSFQFFLQLNLAVGNSLFHPVLLFRLKSQNIMKCKSCSSDSQDQYRVYDTAANFWPATELDKRPLLTSTTFLVDESMTASRQKLLETPGNSAFPIRQKAFLTFPEVLQVHPQQRLERDLPYLLFQEAPAEAGPKLELFKPWPSLRPFVQSFSTLARLKKAKHQAERIPRLQL